MIYVLKSSWWRSDITDIDGIFLDEENKVIIIYDDSDSIWDNIHKNTIAFIQMPARFLVKNKFMIVIVNYRSIQFIFYILTKVEIQDLVLEAIQHIFNRTSKVILRRCLNIFLNFRSELENGQKTIYNFVEYFLQIKRWRLMLLKSNRDTPAYLFAINRQTF